MLTIQGLYEIYGQNLAQDRMSMIEEGYNGLGPDDLVSITKEESGFFFSYKTSHSYHFLNGLQLDSPAIFCAYFSDIIRQQQKYNKNKSTFSQNFKITKGRIFSYNSFSRRDVVITVSNPGKCESKTVNEKDEEVSVSEECWNQLRISTLLRFYRASQPLHNCIFETHPFFTPTLVSYTGGKLTMEDFNYIVQHHQTSNELQTALSFALLCSLSIQKVKQFVQKHIGKYPLLLPKLTLLIPKTTSFGEYFYNSLVFPTYQLIPDDVETAINITLYHLDHENLKESLHFVPLLKASIISNPKSGSCLSRICVAHKKYHESFIFLNATANALSYSDVHYPIFHQKYKITTPPNTIPYGPSSSESQLLNATISGPKYLFFTEIARLMESIGEEKYLKILGKMNPKSNNKIQHFFENQFLSEQSNKPKEKKNENYKYIDDCLYLYDPGIECDNLDCGNFESLPFSNLFLATSLQVKECMRLRNEILQKLKTISIPQILSLGFRLNDDKLIEFALNNIDQNNLVVSYLSEIIMIKIIIDGHSKILQKLPPLQQLEKETITQGTAFPLVITLYKAIQKKNQKFKKKEDDA